jgi:hypothetical protein
VALPVIILVYSEVFLEEAQPELVALAEQLAIIPVASWVVF